MNGLERFALTSNDFHATLGKYLFESASLALILVDKNGVILKVNKAYEEWCGLSASNLEGQHMSKVVENARLHIVAETGIPEINQIQKCFGKIIISDRIPIFNEKGQSIGAFGIVLFNDYQEITNLVSQIERQKSKIRQYEEELRLYRTGKYTFADIIGCSKPLEKAKTEALKVARAELDVLIQGETGTGKELFAHSIHNASSRSGGPIISVNCSAIAANLFESELFGYEGGTFTGADKTGRKGKFELAHKGTIFLDEIGDMPLELQPKILRVLEEREFVRVGSSTPMPLDIMVVAATNRDLRGLMHQGLFSEDLYYRLSSFILKIPPIR